MYSFETELGFCCVAWNPQGVDFLELPGEDRERTEQRCRQRAGDRPIVARPPRTISELAKRVRQHLGGKAQRFSDVPVDEGGLSPFRKKTYRALRKVPAGQVLTYGELAKRMGNPKAARAIGRAMATNPIPLIIPCHRVLRGDRSLGGFSAAGGTSCKARMLLREGVILPAR